MVAHSVLLAVTVTISDGGILGCVTRRVTMSSRASKSMPCHHSHTVLNSWKTLIFHSNCTLISQCRTCPIKPPLYLIPSSEVAAMMMNRFTRDPSSLFIDRSRFLFTVSIAIGVLTCVVLKTNNNERGSRCSNLFIISTVSAFDFPSN